ncbi:unnamed protein product [Cyprideis torosa]|uniref:Uncharacterized protein n=1 Tax=Cyprideis torosa TaxID=163714 RepID=A0A7R8W4U3_9CRUS|nr:unnamed protein product [Cyprideis torosa]CAG0884546.1 unnamed protein product [Cyprideis torosa]
MERLRHVQYEVSTAVELWPVRSRAEWLWAPWYWETSSPASCPGLVHPTRDFSVRSVHAASSLMQDL